MSVGSCPDLYLGLEWLSDDVLLYYRVFHWMLHVLRRTQLLFQWVCMILSSLVCRAGMAKWWCPVILQGVPLKVGCCVEHTAAFSMSIRFSPYRVLFCFPPSVGALQTRTTEENVRRIVRRGELECTVVQTCLGELCTRAAAVQGCAQWFSNKRKPPEINPLHFNLIFWFLDLRRFFFLS